jgi:hypothetical protein
MLKALIWKSERLERWLKCEPGDVGTKGELVVRLPWLGCASCHRPELWRDLYCLPSLRRLQRKILANVTAKAASRQAILRQIQSENEPPRKKATMVQKHFHTSLIFTASPPLPEGAQMSPLPEDWQS